MPRLDWTSCNYLGSTLRSASGLAVATGRPAVLGVSAVVRRAEQELAQLVAQPCAWLAPSTLHLLFDLQQWGQRHRAIFILERGAYALLKKTLGCSPGLEFTRGDLAQLERALAHLPERGPRVLVVEGVVAQGPGPQLAPLQRYQRLCQQYGALLVVDDSQALGLLGARTGPVGWGSGGGGSLPYHFALAPPVLVVASLAKSFGVPAAFAAGPCALIKQLYAQGPSAVHASPASNVDAEYVLRALAHNRQQGRPLRRRLRRLIRQWRLAALSRGLPLLQGAMPLQAIGPFPRPAAEVLHQRLRSRGISALMLHYGMASERLLLAVIIRADCTLYEIEATVGAIASVMTQWQRGPARSAARPETLGTSVRLVDCA